MMKLLQFSGCLGNCHRRKARLCELYFIDDFSYVEIARFTNLSPTTVEKPHSLVYDHPAQLHDPNPKPRCRISYRFAQ